MAALPCRCISTARSPAPHPQTLVLATPCATIEGGRAPTSRHPSGVFPCRRHAHHRGEMEEGKKQEKGGKEEGRPRRKEEEAAAVGRSWSRRPLEQPSPERSKGHSAIIAVPRVTTEPVALYSSAPP